MDAELWMLHPARTTPRNSEGAFIRLHDGRIRFVYSRFVGGPGGDDAPAHIAGRYAGNRQDGSDLNRLRLRKVSTEDL